jgi:transcriptional regulator with XRE-family HTH domain
MLSFEQRIRFGTAVRLSRRTSDLTQRQLGERTGMTSMRVYQIERGHARVRPGELEALIRELPALADILRPRPARPLVLGRPVIRTTPPDPPESSS